MIAVPPLLEVRDLQVTYGHVQAVRGVSLRVEAGQIVALIGPNGAGKSSTLNAIAGMVRPSAGQVHLQGKDVAGLPAHAAVAAGIVLVPEGRAILGRMTVEENLVMGAEARPWPSGADNPTSAPGESALQATGLFPAARPAQDTRPQGTHPAQTARAAIDAQLQRFPSLERRRHTHAGSLSGGEQQMLAIARGLLGRPRILLLDEPSMGLAPQLVRQIFAIIRDIHREGTTILLVEQNARMALLAAQYAYVLERGQVALEGPASELAKDPRVQAAYLGG